MYSITLVDWLMRFADGLSCLIASFCHSSGDTNFLPLFVILINFFSRQAQEEEEDEEEEEEDENAEEEESKVGTSAAAET